MNLQYTFCNEDTETEVSCLNTELSLLTIAGSGSRVIPLLRSRPKRLVCIDNCEYQLYLTEMRITALKELTYDEYCILLGYKSAAGVEREQIFEQLNLHSTAKSFLRGWFKNINWGCLIFSGYWERQIINSSRIFKTLIPRASNDLFSCKNLDRQKKYLTKITWRLSIVLLLIFASAIIRNMFSSLRSFHCKLKIKPTFTSSLMYLKGLRKFCENKHIKNNYFYSPFILGRYDPNTAPTPEISKEHYSLCKSAMKSCKIEYVHCDIFQYAEREQNKFDFISLSNVVDYCCQTSLEKNMESCKKSLKSKGIVFVRQHTSANTKIQILDTDIINERLFTQLKNDDTPFYKITVFQKNIETTK